MQAQEARVVARVDTPFEANVYAFLDGEFGKHFSYSVSTHFVDGKNTGDLYRNTWKAWDNNWCDWANLSYSIAGFSFSAGKDMILNGLHEFSPADVDNWSLLCSSFWNELNPYQLGVKAEYAIEAIATTVQLQYSNSPCDEKPFGGHSTISFGLQGDFGVFQPYYTLNRITMDEDTWGIGKFCALSLGNSFQITDDLLLNIDYLGKFAPEAPAASSILGGVEYSFLEGMKLVGRAGWEKSDGPILEALEFGNEGFFGGLAFEFRPLSFLRFHTAGSYNQALGMQYDFGASLDLEFSK